MEPYGKSHAMLNLVYILYFIVVFNIISLNLQNQK